MLNIKQFLYEMKPQVNLVPVHRGQTLLNEQFKGWVSTGAGASEQAAVRLAVQVGPARKRRHCQSRPSKMHLNLLKPSGNFT
jgi:hypothetical protein